MQLLVIDNFDSFTFNLVRYFQELGCEVLVKRNNQISLQQIRQLAPDLIVISPGPCTPNESGVSLEVIEHLAGHIPILGVCLGHQAIAQVFGAEVIRADRVMHGKVSQVVHFGHEMFSGLPESFQVTRYHSLVVSDATLPEELQVTAVVKNAVTKQQHIMAIAHKTKPLWGVQFHPESHLTEYGHKLLGNIIKLAALL